MVNEVQSLTGDAAVAPKAKKGLRITSLLDHEVLQRAERLRLNPLRRLTNRARGEHLQGRAGSSIDFADYRNYTVGDDIRYVDWNIFARLNRPYLKLFQHEEEMHIVLLVDASSSMQFEQKFERARQLAAAFGVMGLMNLERVSAYAFNQRDSRITMLRPCSGRVSMHKLFGFLESIECGGDAQIEEAVDLMLGRHRGRGIAILLSDFLTYADLRRSFNLIFSAGLEIFALQVLGPSELDPEIIGDLRMVDSESGRTLDVSAAGDLVGMYQEYRRAFERRLDSLTKQRSGRFLTVSSDSGVRHLLFDTLRRRGWIV